MFFTSGTAVNGADPVDAAGEAVERLNQLHAEIFLAGAEGWEVDAGVRLAGLE